MDTPAITIPHVPNAAAHRLAEALLHAEPIVAFCQAKADFEAAPVARRLLDQVAAAQAELRFHQKSGSVTQLELDQLRVLQRQASANPVIVRYLETQQMANDCLLAINQEISQLIGLDFGAMARPTCC